MPLALGIMLWGSFCVLPASGALATVHDLAYNRRFYVNANPLRSGCCFVVPFIDTTRDSSISLHHGLGLRAFSRLSSDWVDHCRLLLYLAFISEFGNEFKPLLPSLIVMGFNV